VKILAPLNNKDNISLFHAAGADELYLGFYDEHWKDRFGDYTDINRMSGFKKTANRYSILEIPEIIQEILAHNMGAYITINANVYSAEALDYLKDRYFPIFAESGVSGVIVSTENVAKCAVAYGLPVVASTIMGLYNSDIVKYYRSIGIKRMIMPRDLSLKEISAIREKAPDIDLEVFFMRRGCVFSDAYCLGAHREECGSICGRLRLMQKQIICEQNQCIAEENDNLYQNAFHRDACGMCALYRLREIGVSALKIVGRADSPESLIEDIHLTMENMKIMQNSSSESEFLSRMILPKDSKKQCRSGLSCYYPEVRYI